MTEALGLDESPNPPDTSDASEDMYIAHARKGVADEGRSWLVERGEI